jgi:hypothetical protein
VWFIIKVKRNASYVPNAMGAGSKRNPRVKVEREKTNTYKCGKKTPCDPIQLAPRNITKKERGN